MPTNPTPDLDTFLTTVYVVLDDVYRERFAAQRPVRRPGARPRLSDSEVLTLGLLAQQQPRRSERAFLRHVQRYWRGYFPSLLSQSSLNRRLRDLAPVLLRLGPLLRQRLRTALGEGPAPSEAIDGVAVPLLRRCRGDRHRLFGDEADVGRGGSDKAWYYGVKLVVGVDPVGLLTGWVMGPASTEEHWLAEALCRWRQDPTAPTPTPDELDPVLGAAHRHHGARRGPRRLFGRSSAGAPADGWLLADLGYRGAAWRAHWWDAYAAAVSTKQDAADLPPGERAAVVATVQRLRQAIERAFSRLDDVFGLTFPRARTLWGLLTRLAAKVAAFNLGVTLNYRFNRPPHAFVNPFG